MEQNEVTEAITDDIKLYEESLDKPLEKGTRIYYARIMPNIPSFDVLDLKVRTVEETWFSAVDNRTKQAFLFGRSDLDKTVFFGRVDALNKVNIAQDEFKTNQN